MHETTQRHKRKRDITRMVCAKRAKYIEVNMNRQEETARNERDKKEMRVSNDEATKPPSKTSRNHFGGGMFMHWHVLQQQCEGNRRQTTIVTNAMLRKMRVCVFVPLLFADIMKVKQIRVRALK